MSVHIQHPNSSRLMMRSGDIHTGRTPPRTTLTVGITSFDLVGWHKWVLWSYVRLLHKPQRAETERESDREGGGGIAAPLQRGFALHQILLPLHMHAHPCHNNIWAFSCNMCFLRNNETHPFIYIQDTQTHTQVPHPHASAVHQLRLFVIVQASTHLFPLETNSRQWHIHQAFISVINKMYW